MRRAIPFLVLALGLVLSAPLRAQGGDKALAEELFREGQALMQAQKYSEACPKFAESQRLDPGTGTLLNLGVCHEREGKLASAWAEFNEVLTLAQRDGRQDRVQYARDRIAAVEPRLSRLKIEISPSGDAPGLEVSLDGKVVGRAALGIAIPVDPGPHEIGATAPGKRPFKTTVVAPEGPGRVAVLLPALEDAPAELQEPAAGPTTGSAAPVTRDKASADGSTQRAVAYVLGGVGIAGIGIGSVFGLNAISKNDESNRSGCSGNACSPGAADLRRDAQSAGTLSTVAFVIGGAALAGGVVLFFTAPSASSESAPAATARATLLPGGGSLELGAVW